MSVKTTEHDRNEQLIRRLYYLAEATSEDTAQFISLFADGSYFYDVSAGITAVKDSEFVLVDAPEARSAPSSKAA
jgi:hypothetical protein